MDFSSFGSDELKSVLVLSTLSPLFREGEDFPDYTLMGSGDKKDVLILNGAGILGWYLIFLLRPILHELVRDIWSPFFNNAGVYYI